MAGTTEGGVGKLDFRGGRDPHAMVVSVLYGDDKSDSKQGFLAAMRDSRHYRVSAVRISLSVPSRTGLEDVALTLFYEREGNARAFLTPASGDCTALPVALGEVRTRSLPEDLRPPRFMGRVGRISEALSQETAGALNAAMDLKDLGMALARKSPPARVR